MTTQPLWTDQNPRRGRREAPRDSGAGRRMRYRLDVLALDPADAARFAGGWLFDRAMAGWDVNVLTLVAADPRPLRILGARVAHLRGGIEAVFGGPEHATGLAVSAAALVDERVHDGVLDRVRAGGTEVALWGGPWPDRFGAADDVGHRLSAAARVFKAHALTAAGVDATVGATEVLQRGGYRPIDSDLR